MITLALDSSGRTEELCVSVNHRDEADDSEYAFNSLILRDNSSIGAVVVVEFSLIIALLKAVVRINKN